MGAGVVALVGVAMVAAAQDSPIEEQRVTGPESSEASEDEPTTSPSSSEPAYRAFEHDSWWNTALPARAPEHPDGDEILDYLRTAPESGPGCLMLAGASGSPWGHPIYWAEPSDPEYDLEGYPGDPLPELEDVRIPVGAEPADNSDGSMTVYDKQRGYVVALTDAEFDEDSETWTATGATVTYLRSNGLHDRTGRSDDPRNLGTHRGNNGATMAVAWEEVQAGAIRHVLKIAVGPQAADRYVFPMVGSDGDYDGDDPAVPAQGLRLRIRPSLDLDDMNLDREAQVIAEALQRYGMYIGDSGGTTALKLEDTDVEGRGQLWSLAADALCDLPFTSSYWQVVAEGYDPSRSQ